VYYHNFCKEYFTVIGILCKECGTVESRKSLVGSLPCGMSAAYFTGSKVKSRKSKDSSEPGEKGPGLPGYFTGD